MTTLMFPDKRIETEEEYNQAWQWLTILSVKPEYGGSRRPGIAEERLKLHDLIRDYENRHSIPAKL